jgi:hypothetical protein
MYKFTLRLRQESNGIAWDGRLMFIIYFMTSLFFLTGLVLAFFSYKIFFLFHIVQPTPVVKALVFVKAFAIIIHSKQIHALNSTCTPYSYFNRLVSL